MSDESGAQRFVLKEFKFNAVAVQRLRRRLADAGRSPTLVIRSADGSCTLRIVKENGDVVQKDADDGDITNV